LCYDYILELLAQPVPSQGTLQNSHNAAIIYVYRHDTQLEAASDAFCQQTPIVNGPEYSAGYSFLNALMKLAPPSPPAAPLT